MGLSFRLENRLLRREASKQHDNNNNIIPNPLLRIVRPLEKNEAHFSVPACGVDKIVPSLRDFPVAENPRDLLPQPS